MVFPMIFAGYAPEVVNRDDLVPRLSVNSVSLGDGEMWKTCHPEMALWPYGNQARLAGEIHYKRKVNGKKHL